MRHFLRALFVLLFLLIARIKAIEYELIHSNTLITYQNEHGVWYAASNAMSNLTARERPFAGFQLITNGGQLKAQENFNLVLKAVDDAGYHVTITNSTNVLLSVKNADSTPAAGILTPDAVSFISPSVVFPDFTGITANFMYSLAGTVRIMTAGGISQSTDLLYFIPPDAVAQIYFSTNIYAGYGADVRVTVFDPARNSNSMLTESVQSVLYSSGSGGIYTNTLYETGPDSGYFSGIVPINWVSSSDSLYLKDADILTGSYTTVTAAVRSNQYVTTFREIHSLHPQGPVFLAKNENAIPLFFGKDPAGALHNISAQLSFTSKSSVVTVPTGKTLSWTNPGTGIVSGTYGYDRTLSAESIVLAAIDHRVHTRITSGISADIPPDTFTEPVHIDLRSADSPGGVYAVTDYRPYIRQASLNTALYIFSEKAQQLTITARNLAQNALLPSKPVTLTYGYSDTDIAADRRIAPEHFRLVRLTFEGSAAVWTDMEGTTDHANHTVQASVQAPGVYTLAAVLTAPEGSIEQTALYPNPVNFSKEPFLYVMNIPEDAEYIRIFRSSGRLVRELTPANGIGWYSFSSTAFFGGRWDGKDSEGREVRMDMYFIEIRAGTKKTVKKILVHR